MENEVRLSQDSSASRYFDVLSTEPLKLPPREEWVPYSQHPAKGPTRKASILSNVSIKPIKRMFSQLSLSISNRLRKRRGGAYTESECSNGRTGSLKSLAMDITPEPNYGSQPRKLRNFACSSEDILSDPIYQKSNFHSEYQLPNFEQSAAFAPLPSMLEFEIDQIQRSLAVDSGASLSIPQPHATTVISPNSSETTLSVSPENHSTSLHANIIQPVALSSPAKRPRVALETISTNFHRIEVDSDLDLDSPVNNFFRSPLNDIASPTSPTGEGSPRGLKKRRKFSTLKLKQQFSNQEVRVSLDKCGIVERDVSKNLLGSVVVHAKYI